MKQGSSVKKCIHLLLTCLVAAVLLLLLQRLLVPKYVHEAVEGRFIHEYYGQAQKDFDVLFLGDCEVYDSYATPVLWREYGIHSYIRGSAKQQVWQSCYLLSESLRDHVPKVVVFNVQALQYGEPQEESYNRMTLDGMRWSMDKVGAVRASLGKDESFLSYLFPILRFHGRWKELSTEDLTAFFGTEELTYNGYYLSTEQKPVGDIPEGTLLPSYEFSDKAWDYLERIRTLCEEHQVTLLLVKAPSLYPTWYEEYETQVTDYAASHGRTYLNFLELSDAVGIDFATDTPDGGLHLNVYGAEKMARYIAPYLYEGGAADRRDETVLAADWELKLKRYDEAKTTN